MTNIYIQFFKKFDFYKLNKLRDGQSVWLAIKDIDSELAEQIKNSDNDCFHNDKNIPTVLNMFYNKYKERWKWTI